jgi:hypothetical protein
VTPSVSHELAVESERRLQAVHARARIVHLEGGWHFRRVEGGGLPEEALALVRDEDGWSALLPAPADAQASLAVTRTTFAERPENSGYLGWLASLVKERTGSGVLVICGHNPARGGIFDYLGYPSEQAGEIRALIEELRTADEQGDAQLDLRVFEVVETSPASEITRETLFEFRARKGLVEACYAGGAIARGWLLGRRENDLIRTAYAQLGRDGALSTGAARMRIDTSAAQPQLIEEYAWSDGSTGVNVLRAFPPRG